MWLTTRGLFLLLIGRELSWGRVFFQTKMTESQIPHNTLINVFLGVFITLLVIGVIFTIPWKAILFKVPVPWTYFILILIGVIFSLIGDHGWIFSGYRGETLEELGELSFYFLLDIMTLYYYHYLNKIRLS